MCTVVHVSHTSLPSSLAYLSFSCHHAALCFGLPVESLPCDLRDILDCALFQDGHTSYIWTPGVVTCTLVRPHCSLVSGLCTHATITGTTLYLPYLARCTAPPHSFAYGLYLCTLYALLRHMLFLWPPLSVCTSSHSIYSLLVRFMYCSLDIDVGTSLSFLFIYPHHILPLASSLLLC